MVVTGKLSIVSKVTAGLREDAVIFTNALKWGVPPPDLATWWWWRTCDGCSNTSRWFFKISSLTVCQCACTGWKLGSFGEMSLYVALTTSVMHVYLYHSNQYFDEWKAQLTGWCGDWSQWSLINWASADVGDKMINWLSRCITLAGYINILIHTLCWPTCTYMYIPLCCYCTVST